MTTPNPAYTRHDRALIPLDPEVHRAQVTLARTSPTIIIAKHLLTGRPVLDIQHMDVLRISILNLDRIQDMEPVAPASSALDLPTTIGHCVINIHMN